MMHRSGDQRGRARRELTRVLASPSTEKSIEHLDRAVALALDAGEPAMAAQFRLDQGQLLLERHEFSDAATAVATAAELFKRLGDAERERRAIELGFIALHTGIPPQTGMPASVATPRREEARRLAVLLAVAIAFGRGGRADLEADTHYDRATLLEALKRHDGAADEFARAAQVYCAIGNLGDSAKARVGRAMALSAAGRHTDALDDFGRAARLFRSTGDEAALAGAELGLIKELLSLRRWDHAAAHCARLVQAAANRLDIPMRQVNAEALNYRATALAMSGRFEAALHDIEEALEIATEVWPVTRSTQLRMKLGHHFRMMKRLRSAADTYDGVLASTLRSGPLDLAEAALEALGDVLVVLSPKTGVGRFSEVLQIAGAAQHARLEAMARFYRASCMEQLPPVRHGDCASEYIRAAEFFHASGDTGRAAPAYYFAAKSQFRDASTDLSATQRDALLMWLDRASQGAAATDNWLLKGMAEEFSGSILSVSVAGTNRDDKRIVAHLREATHCFERSGSTKREVAARGLLALALQREGHTTEWLDAALDAIRRYDDALPQYLDPGEDLDSSHALDVFRLFAMRAADSLDPTDPRWRELAWAVEQATKGQWLRETDRAEIWTQLQADDELRRRTREVDAAQLAIETAQADRDMTGTQQARDMHRNARRAQRRRLAELAAEAVGEPIVLACSGPLGVAELQSRLADDEMYLGMVSSGDAVLRSRVTRRDARFDVVKTAGLAWQVAEVAAHGIPIDALPETRRDLRHAIFAAALNLMGPLPPDVGTVIVCPDWHLLSIPWHLVHPTAVTCIVPTPGGFRRPRTTLSDEERSPYLGVADSQGGRFDFRDDEVHHVAHKYFAQSGCCLTTEHAHALLHTRGHFALLHIACHASAGGLYLGSTPVTPVELLGIDSSAELLLLTGCDIGRGEADKYNAFVGVLRGLMISTGARAAIVSFAPVPEPAAMVFSDLVVAALTGHAASTTSARSPAKLTASAAVRWARLQTESLQYEDVAELLPNPVLALSRDPSWWRPWYVFGDPKAQLQWSS